MTEKFALFKLYARKIYSKINAPYEFYSHTFDSSVHKSRYTIRPTKMLTYFARLVVCGSALVLVIWFAVVISNDQAVVVPIVGIVLSLVLSVAMLGALFSKYQTIFSCLLVGPLVLSAIVNARQSFQSFSSSFLWVIIRNDPAFVVPIVVIFVSFPILLALLIKKDSPVNTKLD